ALPAGHALASVTDFHIDRLSNNEENLWLGLGNIGLVPTSDTGGVWFSPNHGDTWFRSGNLGNGMPDAATFGTNIRRITIGLPTGRVADEGTVYALINNPNQPNRDEFASGVYKTIDGGKNWTHVMLR